jgi:hypothetical protein
MSSSSSSSSVEDNLDLLVSQVLKDFFGDDSLVWGFTFSGCPPPWTLESSLKTVLARRQACFEDLFDGRDWALIKLVAARRPCTASDAERDSLNLMALRALSRVAQRKAEDAHHNSSGDASMAMAVDTDTDPQPFPATTAPPPHPSLPLVVIDGSNVARRMHGAVFDREQLESCLSFFLQRGAHPVAFVPDQVARSARLDDLLSQGLVVCVPPQSSDDEFLLQYAFTRNAPIVTNDMFRDHLAFVARVKGEAEAQSLRQWFTTHLISYTFDHQKSFVPNPRSGFA